LRLSVSVVLLLNVFRFTEKFPLGEPRERSGWLADRNKARQTDGQIRTSRIIPSKRLDFRCTTTAKNVR